MMTCHECGQTMVRDARPVVLIYEGHFITVDLPGWYCACGESVHSSKEMTVSDRALDLLKARAGGLLDANPGQLTLLRDCRADCQQPG
ncbi:MAG: YgiT-type zinc finger protein [Magnetococcales bacterium]|nr:YgiT-type zinc finger protein [Magnetococcales bacterium]